MTCLVSEAHSYIRLMVLITFFTLITVLSIIVIIIFITDSHTTKPRLLLNSMQLKRLYNTT